MIARARQCPKDVAQALFISFAAEAVPKRIEFIGGANHDFASVLLAYRFIVELVKEERRIESLAVRLKK